MTLLNHLIDFQSKSFKSFIFYTFILIFLGLVLLIIGRSINTNSLIKTITEIGGTFICSLSGFSIKEYLSKKDNLKIYQMWKINIELNKDDDDEQSKIKNILQNLLLKPTNA